MILEMLDLARDPKFLLTPWLGLRRKKGVIWIKKEGKNQNILDILAN